MDIKIVYYVDVDDNTKGSLCAVSSEKDMRTNEVVKKIAEAIETSMILDSYMLVHAMDIAKAIAHHGFSNIGSYEFGVEETELI